MRVHRICVALGSEERALAETGERGLTVSAVAQDDAARLTVGRVNQARGWVHVVDDESLPIVLRELSTVPDFVHYLRAKEAF